MAGDANDTAESRRRGASRTRDRLLQPSAVATVRRILDGGRAAIKEYGYHGAGIDEIVRAAHVSRATFYLYFDGKAELLRALVIKSMDARNAVGPFPMLRGRTATRDVKRWLTAIAAVEEEHGAVWDAWRGELGNDVVLQLLDETRARQSTAQYVEAVRGAEGGSRHPPEIAALVIASLERHLFSYLPPTTPARRDRELDSVAALVVQAVTGRRARATG